MKPRRRKRKSMLDASRAKRDEKMTQSVVDAKEAKKEALKARSADMDKREKELNAGKSGKGLRTFLAMTRGKGTTEIQYEGWDFESSDSLPGTLSEFMGLRPALDESAIVYRLLLGDNEVSYTEASDPVAEFVEPTWPDEVKKQFRIVVKNYAGATNISIEDAVTLIKPGFVASQKKA